MEISLENLKKYGLESTLAEHSNERWLRFPDPDSPCVGEIYGDEREAIAAEIAKCVNFHDRLKKLVKETVAEHLWCQQAADTFNTSACPPLDCTCLPCRMEALLAELEEQPKGDIKGEKTN